MQRSQVGFTVAKLKDELRPRFTTPPTPARVRGNAARRARSLSHPSSGSSLVGSHSHSQGGDDVLSPSKSPTQHRGTGSQSVLGQLTEDSEAQERPPLSKELDRVSETPVVDVDHVSSSVHEPESYSQVSVLVSQFVFSQYSELSEMDPSPSQISSSRQREKSSEPTSLSQLQPGQRLPSIPPSMEPLEDSFISESNNLILELGFDSSFIEEPSEVLEAPTSTILDDISTGQEEVSTQRDMVISQVVGLSQVQPPPSPPSSSPPPTSSSPPPPPATDSENLSILPSHPSENKTPTKASTPSTKTLRSGQQTFSNVMTRSSSAKSSGSSSTTTTTTTVTKRQKNQDENPPLSGNVTGRITRRSASKSATPRLMSPVEKDRTPTPSTRKPADLQREKVLCVEIPPWVPRHKRMNGIISKTASNVPVEKDTHGTGAVDKTSLKKKRTSKAATPEPTDQEEEENDEEGEDEEQGEEEEEEDQEEYDDRKERERMKPKRRRTKSPSPPRKKKKPRVMASKPRTHHTDYQEEGEEEEEAEEKEEREHDNDSDYEEDMQGESSSSAASSKTRKSRAVSKPYKRHTDNWDMNDSDEYKASDEHGDSDGSEDSSASSVDEDMKYKQRPRKSRTPSTGKRKASRRSRGPSTPSTDDQDDEQESDEEEERREKKRRKKRKSEEIEDSTDSEDSQESEDKRSKQRPRKSRTLSKKKKNKKRRIQESRASSTDDREDEDGEEEAEEEERVRQDSEESEDEYRQQPRKPHTPSRKPKVRSWEIRAHSTHSQAAEAGETSAAEEERVREEEKRRQQSRASSSHQTKSRAVDQEPSTRRADHQDEKEDEREERSERSTNNVQEIRQKSPVPPSARSQTAGDRTAGDSEASERHQPDTLDGMIDDEWGTGRLKYFWEKHQVKWPPKDRDKQPQEPVPFSPRFLFGTAVPLPPGVLETFVEEERKKVKPQWQIE